MTTDIRRKLIARADLIDNRLGPLPGRDADDIAVLLRESAAELSRLTAENKALRADNLTLVNDLEQEGVRIEAYQRENKAMREALKELVYEVTHLSPLEDDGSHKCKISGAALENALRALSGAGAEKT